MDIVNIYEDENGQWCWNRKAPNHRIISHGESHSRRRDAFRAAERANLDKKWKFHTDLAILK